MSDDTRQDAATTPDSDATPAQGGDVQLERGTYEIIRNRLSGYAEELRTRVSKLKRQSAGGVWFDSNEVVDDAANNYRSQLHGTRHRSNR